MHPAQDHLCTQTGSNLESRRGQSLPDGSLHSSLSPFYLLLPLSIMAKRKSLNNNAGSDDEGNASDGSSGSSAPSLIDVDFDFFAPSPDVDLIALKRLLRQLLYSDSDLFDLHPFAELLLQEGKAGGVGSTIKVDGEESDPFSFVGVVNLNLHQVRLTLCPTLHACLSGIRLTSDSCLRSLAQPGRPSHPRLPSQTVRPFETHAHASLQPARIWEPWTASRSDHQRAAHQHAGTDATAHVEDAG